MVSRKGTTSKKLNKAPSLSSCLRQCCREFCITTSLDGYKYMIACKTKFERFVFQNTGFSFGLQISICSNLWKLIQLLMATLLIYLTHHAWEKFMRTPVITTLESTDYPVNEVYFPGISICNINKVDRKRAEALANRLDDPNLVESLRLLGVFYDYSSAKEKESSLVKLESILDGYFGSNGTKHLDPYELLKELSTPCSEMLSNCFWAGEEYPCMDLFVMETTMEGFCCLFNYVPSRKAELSKIV